MYKRRAGGKKTLNVVQDEDIQKTLDTVLDDEPCTSNLAKKRRDAIDEYPKLPTPVPTNSELEAEVPTRVGIDVCEFTHFKDDVKQILHQISADIKSLKRSHAYELRRLEEKFSTYFTSKTDCRTLSELKGYLNLNEPLQTMESFEEFENNLNTEPDSLEALVCSGTRISNSICHCDLNSQERCSVNRIRKKFGKFKSYTEVNGCIETKRNLKKKQTDE